MESFTIKPNWGVDSVGFDSSKSDIKNILGAPEEVEHPDAEGRYFTWSYHRNRLNFEFYKENNYALSSIDIWNSDLAIFDQIIPNNHHIMLVRNIIHSNVEINDIQEEDEFETYHITICSLNIMFIFEESLLIGMRLFRPEPTYEDFDDYIMS
ncbi:MAG: hypothetical protein OCD76_18870 [Reichenbachiella sp.]